MFSFSDFKFATNITKLGEVLLTDAASLWRKDERGIWCFVVGWRQLLDGEEPWLCE